MLYDRIKIYNKAPLHLLQTESLQKKISMGLKAWFLGSHQLYQKLIKCVGRCLSRIEKSIYFQSAKEASEAFSEPQFC
jgi:hypothetical protein